MAIAEEGYSQRDIALRIGCSQRSVSGYPGMHKRQEKDGRLPKEKTASLLERATDLRLPHRSKLRQDLSME